MIIIKVAVGNSREAFIENSLTKDFNIIYSDDNNRGKTIVIQSLMYSLGNEPTFPSSFDYSEYYHYIEFEINNIAYKLCRKKNNFILKKPNKLLMFDSVSEFKKYWSKNISKLPYINKKNMLKIVDPVLFWQLFFVGQDKKDTFNIANAGHYNKTDFINMLFDYCNLGISHHNPNAEQNSKNLLKSLKEKRAHLLKENKILKSKSTAVNYLSRISDKEAFGEKIQLMEISHKKITTLRNQRSKLLAQKLKWETTIKELNSLNRFINAGELRCMDCNSRNIHFGISKDESFTFDVSSIDMRKEIISSIEQKISSYEDEITVLTESINNEQVNLQEVMSDKEITLETVVAYKNQFKNATDIETEIVNIDIKITELQERNEKHNEVSKLQKEKQANLLKTITSHLKDLYISVVPDSNAILDDLFTKRDEILSGSEATIYHLSKLLAIQKYTQHKFPIIVDSFRAEDLSSNKEEAVLDLYKKIDNQIIFTTTLKEEETNKYNCLVYINSINYSKHQPSKILSASNSFNFQELLADLSIKL